MIEQHLKIIHHRIVDAAWFYRVVTLDVATLLRHFDIYAVMPWRKGNRLRLVNEEQADDETRRIFQEVRQAIAVPALQLFYPVLGAYPAFLRLHWEMVKPIANSEALFCAAERLRADAYTRVHNYFHLPDLRSHERVDAEQEKKLRLTAIADFYHYKEPLLLLLFCYQIQAMEGPTGLASVSLTPHQAPVMLEEPPCDLDEQTAPAPIKKRYEDIRRTLAVPFINPEFCAFARWPKFLDAFWDVLKQMMSSPLYDECRYGLRSTAWSLASQLPGPSELTVEQLCDAGMTSEEVASVARILDLFVQNLTGQLLNVAAAKIALEGGNLVVPEKSSISRRKSKEPAA